MTKEEKTPKKVKAAKVTKEKVDQVEKIEEPQGISYYEAVGRRKVATARVRLYVVNVEPVIVGGTAIAKGATLINGRTLESYFPGEIMKKALMEPFRTTNTMNRFAISVKCSGGGLHGQLDAVIHAVSRALEKVDKEKFRPILKKRGFLTRDPRARERRKPNTGGKARRQKQSPKR